MPDTLLALARGACRLWSEPHVGDSRLGSALIRRAASVSELPDRLSVCGAVPGSGSGGGVPLRTVNPQVARPQATTCEMLGIPISTDNAQQIRTDLLPLSSSRSPDTRHVLPAGGSALLVINRNHDEQCQYYMLSRLEPFRKISSTSRYGVCAPAAALKNSHISTVSVRARYHVCLAPASIIRRQHVTLATRHSRSNVGLGSRRTPRTPVSPLRFKCVTRLSTRTDQTEHRLKIR